MKIVYSIILFVSLNVFSQNTFITGVHELECSYSEDYNVPDKIDFVFTGNPKYIKYFFSDLEKKLRKRFFTKDISFQYLKNNESYQSKNTDKYVFYLHIDNSAVIDEKSGYDRTARFEFEGKLIDLKDVKRTFYFKSMVFVIHDINDQNEVVAGYLYDKLFFK